MAKSAPIDSDKVQKIKDAIQNYPIDVDKVTDALMKLQRNEIITLKVFL